MEEIQDKLIIYDSNLTSKNFYHKLKTLLEENGEFYTSPDGRRTLYKENDSDQLICVIVDHLNLTTATDGRSKKEEIDLISKYAVTLRNQCNVSFFMLMQENRNSASMDRRKADLTECSSEDIADSSAPFQDSEICIGVYYPLKFKLKTHKHYTIIVEDEHATFKGLRGRYRSLQLIKNRQGESEKAIPVNFFGELNIFRPMPKAEEIKDYSPYLSLIPEKRDVESRPIPKEVVFNF